MGRALQSSIKARCSAVLPARVSSCSARTWMHVHVVTRWVHVAITWVLCPGSTCPTLPQLAAAHAARPVPCGHLWAQRGVPRSQPRAEAAVGQGGRGAA